MIMLLALPVLLAVARAHRYLLVYAPSNVLIRQVQRSRPTLRACATLVVLAAGLLVAMKAVACAVAAGAPGWLNLVVLVLAWDAIKMAWVAIAVLIGCFPGRALASSPLIDS
ncbi:hypothetical protein [Nocardioides jishulii]|uniref:Uncharacterized protein n=1 Tax=Nocardioides jishulii TaxID=2575440 RepID=A0A4U2YND2_9ACTN|nr:hypothetical protein [Nocardioides jishulii]QCX27703.1 hypothetical protein FCL41_09325 [Nocardioides jishulii]TKI62510.1 hypothetical protein FC770_08990 [Nocardioides jishulii]